MEYTYMSGVGRHIKGVKQKDLFEFLKYGNYKSFVTLAKSGVPLEQVKELLVGTRISIGGGLVEEIQKRDMRLSYRYFETYNQWEWFDVFHFTSHEWFLLWQDVYQELYQPKRRQSRIDYSHLTGNERGMLYLFTRYVNSIPEDEYYYWAMTELLSLPTDILNLIPVDPNKELEFHNDYFAIHRVGDKLVRDTRHQVRGRLKDKQLSQDWKDYLVYIEDSLTWVLAHVKDDERYLGAMQRFMLQTKVVIDSSLGEFKQLRRTKKRK